MNDAKIISAAIGSQEAFTAVYAHVAESDLGPQAAFVWPLVVSWYGRDPSAPRIDAQLLREMLSRSVSEKVRDIIVGWYDSLPESPSPANAVQALLEAKRFVAQQEHLAAVAAGDFGRAADTWQELEALIAATTLEGRHVEFADVSRIYAPEARGTVVKLHPAALQQAIPGIAPGETVVLLARPNMGKTLFAVHFTGAAARAGHRVDYFGNEEPINTTHRRLVANLNQRDSADCDAAGEAAVAHAIARGLENARLYHAEPGNMRELEYIVKQDKPALVILDQIRNFEGKKDDAMHARLEDLQKEFRAMAARHKFAAISITQAGDSAQGKIWLDMGDVDNSNTGIPGACDALVGIGASAQMKDTNTRAISFPKNKLGHWYEGITVAINPRQSRIL